MTGIRCGFVALVLLLPVAALAIPFPTAQVQYSWPLRLGGEFGLNFYQHSWYDPVAAPFVSVSAGRDGLGLNAGIKGTLSMFFLPVATAGIGASGLYLWEDEDAAYAGARGSVSFSVLSVFSGAYRRISGDTRDEWLFSLGAGVGLP
ncbi:hypothetical protein GX411_01690 [Candidatus Fermentibacteria bacterium]|nr:hypothetical protein [Candidatus Fermentibacteria bacterium]